MSATKIKYYEANTIAARIADKAFEHLLAPHVKLSEAFTKRQYEKILETIGTSHIATLTNLGLLEEDSNCYIEFTSKGREATVEYSPENPVFSIAGYGSRPYKIRDDAVFDEYEEIAGPIETLEKQSRQLSKELQSQLEGKSAKQAMKAWPEAAGIIADYFKLSLDGKDVSMTSPLEVLLAKYLPALPAPV